MKNDPINSPAHYVGKNGMEVRHIIEAYGLGWHLGSAMKYLLRAGKKGPALEDLQKAEWFLREWIEGYEAWRHGFTAPRCRRGPKSVNDATAEANDALDNFDGGGAAFRAAREIILAALCARDKRQRIQHVRTARNMIAIAIAIATETK